MSRKESIRRQILADHTESMAVLKSLTPEQWVMPVPSDADALWTARDVLAHLAVSEGGQLGQITRLLAGEQTVPPDFDLNRFNRGSVRKRADKSVEELLAEIETAHAQVLAALEAVAESDLDKTGRHARGDTITVEEFFTRITAHRRDHTDQLKQALGVR
jgi:hypothetical protein